MLHIVSMISSSISSTIYLGVNQRDIIPNPQKDKAASSLERKNFLVKSEKRRRTLFAHISRDKTCVVLENEQNCCVLEQICSRLNVSGNKEWMK